MIARIPFSLFTLSTILLNCAQVDGELQPKVPEFLTNSEAIEYADSVLATLSTEEQIAQLLMLSLIHI